MLNPVITPAELTALPQETKVVLVDARTGPSAQAQYQQKHLEGARFVDLEKDLAQVPANAAHGGRRPLPDIVEFSTLLGKLGITPTSLVVIYDDKNAPNAAARFWWMLKAAGHERAHVLSGGLQAAQAEGLPTSDVMPAPSNLPPYPVTRWKRPTVGIDQVAQLAGSPDHIVIDVRDAYRYQGESEPIDPVAGHIPGAINVPLTENLSPDGKFLPPAELAEKYKAILGDTPTEKVVVHCGSGVTACHTLLALESAGLKGAKLYVGSWSEWCRNPSRPIATGEK